MERGPTRKRNPRPDRFVMRFRLKLESGFVVTDMPWIPSTTRWPLPEAGSLDRG
jgi:hypothetical protein